MLVLKFAQHGVGLQVKLLAQSREFRSTAVQRLAVLARETGPQPRQLRLQASGFRTKPIQPINGHPELQSEVQHFTIRGIHLQSGAAFDRRHAKILIEFASFRAAPLHSVRRLNRAVADDSQRGQAATDRLVEQQHKRQAAQFNERRSVIASAQN